MRWDKIISNGTVVVSVTCLIVFLFFRIGSLLSEGPVRAPDGFSAEAWGLLNAIDDSAGAIPYVVLVLVSLVCTTYALVYRLDNVESRLERVPASDVQRLDSSAATLDRLTKSIGAAERRIYLMYLRHPPATDDQTQSYWQRTAEQFAGKSTGSPTIRRIASIESLAKLEFLLRNNRDLFTHAGSRIRELDYKLVYFPDQRLKPPQVDVIDDALFLFSPYPGEQHQTLLVTDRSIVNSYSNYYAALVKTLEPQYTLLSTCDVSRSDDLHAVPCYSADEIQNIMRIVKYALGCERFPRSTFDILAPNSGTSWDRFELGFAAVTRWAS